nr:hypothetical protein [Mycobacterium sp. 3519A]
MAGITGQADAALASAAALRAKAACPAGSTDTTGSATAIRTGAGSACATDAAGLACDGAGLTGAALPAGLLTRTADDRAGGACARRGDRRRGRIDSVRTGAAVSAETTGAAVADQTGVAAVSACARGAGEGAVRAVATRAAVTEKTCVAAPSTGLPGQHTIAAAAAVAEEEATVAAALPGKPRRAVADQQATVLARLIAIADEDSDEFANEIAEFAGRCQRER